MLWEKGGGGGRSAANTRTHQHTHLLGTFRHLAEPVPRAAAAAAAAFPPLLLLPQSARGLRLLLADSKEAGRHAVHKERLLSRQPLHRVRQLHDFVAVHAAHPGVDAAQQ
eukprot:160424-Chlamydomonas_euryale.AAC.2